MVYNIGAPWNPNMFKLGDIVKIVFSNFMREQGEPDVKIGSLAIIIDIQTLCGERLLTKVFTEDMTVASTYAARLKLEKINIDEK